MHIHPPLPERISHCGRGHTNTYDASYSKSSKQDCEQNANEIFTGIKSEITKSEGV